ncbi:MAG: hypothetical protein EA351_11320 [Gemmatimonadales bacterium]|nr:MAG: hypothetical protein EA351_11320 [Gemmatimonadales bacterium]
MSRNLRIQCFRWLKWRLEEIGERAEGRPLRLLSFGSGATSVLLWSQMHEDESTASMALADLIHLFATHPDDPGVRDLEAALTIHLFPIMNPDGAGRRPKPRCPGARDPRRPRSDQLRAPSGRGRSEGDHGRRGPPPLLRGAAGGRPRQIPHGPRPRRARGDLGGGPRRRGPTPPVASPGRGLTPAGPANGSDQLPPAAPTSRSGRSPSETGPRHGCPC